MMKLYTLKGITKKCTAAKGIMFQSRLCRLSVRPVLTRISRDKLSLYFVDGVTETWLKYSLCECHCQKVFEVSCEVDSE